MQTLPAPRTAVTDEDRAAEAPYFAAIIRARCETPADLAEASAYFAPFDPLLASLLSPAPALRVLEPAG